MRRIFIPIFALFILFGGITNAQSTKKASNFSLKTAQGKTIELSKLKGKAVVLNFWATWCGPCKAEIPGFLSMYGKYKKKGLEIVGISLDEKGWGVVKPFIEKYKMTYPVVLDEGGSIAGDYGNISAIPTTFFVDRKGNIIDTHVGYMTAEDFEQKIKKIL